MKLPSILRMIRVWIYGPTGYYESPRRADRLQLKVLASLLGR